MGNRNFIASVLAVTCMLLVFMLSCGSEKTNARKYHDKIVSIINETFDSVTETEEVFEQNDTIVVENQLLKHKERLSAYLHEIENLPVYKQDSALFLAATNVLQYYLKIVDENYSVALDRMKESQSTSNADLLLGLSIFSTYYTEDSLNEAFSKQEGLFREKYMK